MDLHKQYKLKYLNLLYKRSLVKLLYIFKHKTEKAPKLKIRIPSNFSPRISSPAAVSLSTLKPEVKKLHRPSNSHSEIPFELAQGLSPASPHPCQSSPSFSLFDQIRSSLQHKANGPDSLKQSETKEKKSLTSKSRLFNPGEKHIYNRHTRNSTLTETNLAVVSSKVFKQPLFTINIVESS